MGNWLVKGDFSDDAEDSFRELVDLNEVVSALDDLDVFFEKNPIFAVSGDKNVSEKNKNKENYWTSWSLTSWLRAIVM